MKNTKRGFTIVELVIVIAVIAILAAILIPVFSNVIETANETGRQAEIKNAYSEFVTDTALENESYAAIEDYIYYDGEAYYNYDGTAATNPNTTAVSTNNGWTIYPKAAAQG